MYVLCSTCLTDARASFHSWQAAESMLRLHLTNVALQTSNMEFRTKTETYKWKCRRLKIYCPSNRAYPGYVDASSMWHLPFYKSLMRSGRKFSTNGQIVREGREIALRATD